MNSKLSLDNNSVCSARLVNEVSPLSLGPEHHPPRSEHRPSVMYLEFCSTHIGLLLISKAVSSFRLHFQTLSDSLIN